MIWIMLRLVALLGALLSVVQAPWRPSFELVQPELFAAAGGQASAWADADGDGDLDLFSAFRDVANRLLRNDGGRFVDVTAAAGINLRGHGVTSAWGDLDNDGRPDLYVGNSWRAAKSAPSSRARGGCSLQPG